MGANWSMMRTRWAALGAAVAVAVGAGGVGLGRATSPDGAAAFVPIAPCRLFDTRPEFQVGDRDTPLGADDTHTVTATGPQGECALPTSAVGVVLNVTAVDATLPTFLTIWPDGVAQPNASALNPAPGEAPAPNAVTVDLSDDGRFSVYNLQGTVHVLADVVGYYTDHAHDDRYYTKAQVDTAIAATKSISIDPLSVHIAGIAELIAFDPHGSGVVMPREIFQSAQLMFTVTLPPDYTPDSVVTVAALWSIDESGCTIKLHVNSMVGIRYGAGPTFGESGLAHADSVPATPEQVARSTFEYRPLGGSKPGLAPGDALYVQLYRESSGETCVEPLLVRAIEVQYT